MHAPVHVRSLFFSLVFVFLPFPFCLSTDTITLGKPISDLAEETLVSANSFFELGFFTPNGSSSSRRYVGIWYYGYDPLTVVWVANRDKPLSTNTGFFGLAEDGNLAIWNSSQRIWSSTLKGEVSFNRTIRLMDTGNLVLSEVGESQYLWQSFENPTDTFIPGMAWSEDFKLTSWNAVDDPTLGNFTFLVDPDRTNQYMIQQQDTSLSYWKSGLYGKLQSTDDLFTVISCLLSSSSCSQPSNPRSQPSNPYNNISRSYNVNYNHSRLVMDSTGQIQFYIRINDSAPWSLYGYRPRDVCSIFKYCGNYGSCSSENRVPCKCLPGFEPTSPQQWSSGEFSAGCMRKSALCDINEFISLKKMKAGSPQGIEADSEAKCKKICLNSCDCQAYYYLMASPSREGLGSSSTCWTWSSDLVNVLEQTEDGYNLNVRIASTDIDPLKRSCKFCGTNVVPYPLSTGESCGDSLHSRFYCDNETSQLYFRSYNVLYRVTYVIPEAKKFAINIDDNKTSCTSKDLLNKTLQLDHSRQFYLINGCNSSRNFTLNSFSQDQVLYEVEIGWSAPPAPSCASKSDCEDWPSTTCNATGDGKKICRCNANPSWNPSSNCAPAKNSIPTGRSSSNKKPLYLIALVAIAILILAVGLFYYRRKGQENENVEAIQENLAFRLHDSEQRIKEWISSSQFQEEDKKNIDVPFFDLKVILAATHNFSNENKLGQGGFGPVYKGTFPGGQEIAIKRLSSSSGQGLEEFKNEVVLIAKLQHRNLVRLLGYCIEGEEKLLLYEYMPNGSLDSFIFDRTRCLLLTWELRFEIIIGIARGMLYLHQDSRLRIIHRDMKSSNILLDEEMNPKISDFGLARIFESKQTEATTKKVIGTYGYMSPEYALDGFFSFKSDVFSFGVVVLEIVSGKRNTGFYQSTGTLNLISHAWKFWTENNALNLMDHALHESNSTSEVLKCINVALLCVQDDPGDRPTMSMVLSMLGSEGATLPTPKRPGFAVNRSQATTSSSSKPETIYDMSITAIQGR